MNDFHEVISSIPELIEDARIDMLARYLATYLKERGR